MSEKNNTLSAVAVAMLSGMFALGGVWLGSDLASLNAARIAKKERRLELRLQSYQRLAALEQSWAHAVEAVQFARADYTYWSTRYDYLTHDAADLQRGVDAEKMIDQQLASAASVRRDLYETLGTIELVFDVDAELAKMISDYKTGSNAVSIGHPTVRPASEADLRLWFNTTTTEMSRRAANLATLSEAVRLRIAPQLRVELR